MTEDELWESILPHRFIMTFKVAGFSVPKLEERLSDLTEQGIFFPDMLLIDGLSFDEESRQLLLELKKLAKSYALRAWFAVRTHRHEDSGPNGTPAPLINVLDLFDIAIHLQPDGDELHVKVLKGGLSDTDRPLLFLDPATMLIKEKK